MKSELPENILKIIDETSNRSKDFEKAFTDLMAMEMGIPDNAQVTRVAKIYAAYRESPEVQAAIGDNINAFEGWVVPEMYIQIDRAIALQTAG